MNNANIWCYNFGGDLLWIVLLRLKPSTKTLSFEWHSKPSACQQMQAHTGPSKHVLELSMAEAKVTTTEWGGYLCRSLHITSISGKKKLYRFGQRQRKALSAATQRNTLRDQNPKGQLWPRAVLWCPVCLYCSVAKWQMWKHVMIAILCTLWKQSSMWHLMETPFVC